MVGKDGRRMDRLIDSSARRKEGQWWDVKLRDLMLTESRN